MQIKQDYYQILGIPPNACLEEIREAYRKLAFQYHPDRNQMSLGSDEKMREINEAYATLSNSRRRKNYDTPLGYNCLVPKFDIGSKVRVNSHSNTSYRDHVGTVERQPTSDNFRFWYYVKFELMGMVTVNRFAEEELNEVTD
jgi:curved DNA-binding protein CbpA